MNWQKQVDGFKAGMKIEAPSLATAYIRFGFFGLVGGGKSVTAGIFALGITPVGLIGWIDGEGRRSGYAIDQVCELASKHYGKPKVEIEARFKVIHVDPPFNPLAGVAAIDALLAAGCKTIICDFCSQIWDSEGGYLDMKEAEIDHMAGDDEAKRYKANKAASAHIKPWTHGKFVAKVNSAKANIILIFQAKQKWNSSENKPNEFTSPIQESGLTRTALAVGCVEQNDQGEGGYCKFNLPLGQGTKTTHPGLVACLPKNKEQFGFKHAEAVAKWAGVIETKPADPLKPLKAKLWAMLKPSPTAKLTVEEAEQTLRGWKILDEGQTLAGLTPEQLEIIIEKVTIQLQPA